MTHNLLEFFVHQSSSVGGGGQLMIYDITVALTFNAFTNKLLEEDANLPLVASV